MNQALGTRHQALEDMAVLCDYEFGHLQSVRDAIVRDRAMDEVKARRTNRFATVERLRSWLANRNLSPNSGTNKNWKRMRQTQGA
jgi:hypothetical protein